MLRIGITSSVFEIQVVTQLYYYSGAGTGFRVGWGAKYFGAIFFSAPFQIGK